MCAALGSLPFVNTEMMNLFLDHVSRDFKDFFVIMIVDQKGWHMTKHLTVPSSIPSSTFGTSSEKRQWQIKLSNPSIKSKKLSVEKLEHWKTVPTDSSIQ